MRMNKFITKSNLLATFPSSLAEDEIQLALASVTAAKLVELYESNDILALYARIDDLDETLLDILAYDFKIDWWDENYSLTEKRETFKQCWSVHRSLGTASAPELAISAVYKSVNIQEWWEYGGCAFYFRLLIDTGNIYVDYDKLARILDRIRYYKNKRSLLESIEISTSKNMPIYIGIALQNGSNTQMQIPETNLDNYTWLVDENGSYLTDENGLILFE